MFGMLSKSSGTNATFSSPSTHSTDINQVPCNANMTVSANGTLGDALNAGAKDAVCDVQTLLNNVGSGYSVYRSAPFEDKTKLREAIEAMSQAHSAMAQGVRKQADALDLDTSQVRATIGPHRPLINLGTHGVQDLHMYMVLWSPVPTSEKPNTKLNNVQDDMEKMPVSELVAISGKLSAVAQKSRDVLAASVVNHACVNEAGDKLNLFPRTAADEAARPDICNPLAAIPATHAAVVCKSDPSKVTLHLGVTRLSDSDEAAAMFMSPYEGVLLLEKKQESDVWKRARASGSTGERAMPVDSLRVALNSSPEGKPSRKCRAEHFEHGFVKNKWDSQFTKSEEMYNPATTITAPHHVDSIMHSEVRSGIISPVFCVLQRQTVHDALLRPKTIEDLRALAKALHSEETVQALAVGAEASPEDDSDAHVCVCDCEEVRALLVQLDPQKLPFTHMNKDTMLAGEDGTVHGWRLKLKDLPRSLFAEKEA
jgi:hypothetical protein